MNLKVQVLSIIFVLGIYLNLICIYKCVDGNNQLVEVQSNDKVHIHTTSTSVGIHMQYVHILPV